MKKYLFSFAVLLGSLCSFSQSGYLGKTVYVDYTPGISLNPDFGSYSSTDFLLSLYGLTHEVSVHKIISRKNEISPFFSFHRTSHQPTDVKFSDVSNKILSYTYGVNFRFYFGSNNSWNTAPMGNYFDLKPFVSNLNLVVRGTGLKEKKMFNVIAPGLALGFGRQCVIRDLLTFSYGAQMSLPFNMLGFGSRGESGDDLSYIGSAVYRNFYKTLFEVRLGIGFLAF